MTTAINDMTSTPTEEANFVVSHQPVALSVPGRAVPLTLKVSAPADGSDLPIILLSHGHGASVFLSSLHGYGPLADYWAAHGFVVIQPTHLDSGTLGLRESDDADAPLYARTRVEDMRHIVDRLTEIENMVPGLAGRLDHDRIAAAGHSMGGHTTCMLMGMRTQEPTDGREVNLRDERIKAGVILAAPGSGDLSDWAANNYPALRHCDFSTMTGQALVVAGDEDLNPMFSDRLSFRWDSYTQSPAPKTLLMMHGAEHMLGGVSGYDAAETTDEDPERVATIRAVALAYLRSVLYPGDTAWHAAVTALESAPVPQGTVTTK